MCERCYRQMREAQTDAMVIANDHMDAQGVPDDSVLRGLAGVQLACNLNPALEFLCTEMWPSPQALLG